MPLKRPPISDSDVVLRAADAGIFTVRQLIQMLKWDVGRFTRALAKVDRFLAPKTNLVRLNEEGLRRLHRIIQSN